MKTGLGNKYLSWTIYDYMRANNHLPPLETIQEVKVLDVIFTPDGRLKNMTANLENEVIDTYIYFRSMLLS